MVRGTTPTLTLKFKRRIIDLNTIERYVLTFKQPFVNLVIDSMNNDFEIDIENGIVSAELTQEQTLKLQPGYAEVQLKLLIGKTVYATRAKRVMIHNSLSDEVLYG